MVYRHYICITETHALGFARDSTSLQNPNQTNRSATKKNWLKVLGPSLLSPTFAQFSLVIVHVCAELLLKLNKGMHTKG